jgi:hypothetical protein
MRFPEPLEQRMYGNPEDVYSAKQSQEARARRMREEARAEADSVSMLKRPTLTVKQRTPHKPLDQFLAEEAAPKQRSEAWKRAEGLFK